MLSEIKEIASNKNEGELWELDLEEEEEIVEEVGDVTQQIIFHMEPEWYGIDMGLVESVMKVSSITEVPYTPDFVRGIVNIRGNIVVVVDIREFFGLEKINLKKESRIVVVKVDEKTTGILVDCVSDVLNIPLKDIQPPLATVTGTKAEFVKGEIKLSDGRFLTLIDLEKVMASEPIILISIKTKEK